MSQLVPHILRYIDDAADVHLKDKDGIEILENSYGLHNLNMAGGFFAKKFSSSGAGNDLERIGKENDSLALSTHKIRGSGRNATYGGPYCLTLGVTRFAGGNGQAKLKLDQHKALHSLFNNGTITMKELTQWDSKNQHYLEKLDKMTLEVAVNAAHRKVLEECDVNGIVGLCAIDTILTNEVRGGRGKKLLKGKGSVEHDNVGNATVQHASTLALHRDLAIKTAVESTYTHLNVVQLLFKEGINSLYSFKDIRSVEAFSKHFPEAYAMDRNPRLSDEKMPFVLQLIAGSNQYLAVPKSNIDSYFPSIEDFESVLPLTVLNLMFVRTESSVLKTYNNQQAQLRNASKPIMPQTPAPSNIISSTMNVHRLCSDESIETAIITIGDATMKNEKWILQQDIIVEAKKINLLVNTPVEVLRFSSKHHDMVVVAGTTDYVSFSINCKKFEVVALATPEDAESTPPDVEVSLLYLFLLSYMLL